MSKEIEIDSDNDDDNGKELTTIWHCDKVTLALDKKSWSCGWCDGKFAKNATKALAHVAKISGHDISVSTGT